MIAFELMTSVTGKWLVKSCSGLLHGNMLAGSLRLYVHLRVVYLPPFSV